MITSSHCSFRTFWIGFCDWFGTRAAMTHKEAWNEARDEHGSLFPFKIVGFAIGALLLLVILAMSAPVLVSQSVAVGATTEHVRIVSQWGTVLVISAVAGAFVISKALRIHRFCREMCERGRAIEAARLR